MAERIFRGFLFLGRRIFPRILSPDFLSFLWGKVLRRILQENPRQKPPKSIIQQKSPTHFCRGAVPRLSGRLSRGQPDPHQSKKSMFMCLFLRGKFIYAPPPPPFLTCEVLLFGTFPSPFLALLQGEIIYAPPPPPPHFGQKTFLRERGGGAYFEAPRGRNFIPPPLLYTPHP